MAARAKLSYLRVPPRKARLVADLVRGKGAGEAATLLRFNRKKSARAIAKLLQSAVANATAGGGVDPDNLFVKQITVNAGPTIKRFQPRAHGRALPWVHRTSHVTVVLGER